MMRPGYPIGLRRPKQGTLFCPTCGRTDLRAAGHGSNSQRIPFHHAPDPPIGCGYPCDGGPIDPASRREYQGRIHTRPSHCLKRIVKGSLTAAD
jgi:hypothetical protein